MSNSSTGPVARQKDTTATRSLSSPAAVYARTFLGATIGAVALLIWHFAVSPITVDAEGNPPPAMLVIAGSAGLAWLAAGIAATLALAVRKRINP